MLVDLPLAVGKLSSTLACSQSNWLFFPPPSLERTSLDMQGISRYSNKSKMINQKRIPGALNYRKHREDSAEF